MSTIFNPNEFILQEIVPPDNKNAILEYDSKAKMMLVRIFGKEGEVKYNSIILSEQLNANILKNIPNELSNDNDRILFFGIFDDGNFVMIKEKMKYDFSIQQAKWIKYDVTDVTIDQAKEIFEILKAALFVEQQSQIAEKTETILNILKKEEYLNNLHLDMCVKRDKMLRDSDYRVISDYPELFDGEKDLWIKWRNELRTVVKSPSEFEDELDYLVYVQEFQWPIDPLLYLKKYPNREESYLSSQDQYEKAAENSATSAQEMIQKSMVQAVNYEQLRTNNGIPVEKQLYDAILKYNLCDDLLNFDISNLKPEDIQ